MHFHTITAITAICNTRIVDLNNNYNEQHTKKVPTTGTHNIANSNLISRLGSSNAKLVTICMLFILNNFVKNLLTVKSSDCKFLWTSDRLPVSTTGFPESTTDYMMNFESLD